MTIKIGTVDYSDKPRFDKPRKNYFDNLNSGDNVFRVLPPVFGLAEKNQYYIKYRVHAGYRGMPDDTGKQRHFSFLCPEVYDFNKKAVKTPCPECVKLKEMAEFYKERSEEYKAKGKTDEEIDEILVAHKQFLDTHFLSAKFHLNAMDQNNKIGLLKVTPSCIMGVKGLGGLKNKVLDLVKEYGPECDPVGMKGVWFNFKRNGAGKFGTTYDVQVLSEIQNIPGVGKVPVLKPAPLTEDILERMETECHDLANLYTKISVAEVQQLVDSDGDPQVVSSLFAKSKQTEEPLLDPDKFIAEVNN